MMLKFVAEERDYRATDKLVRKLFILESGEKRKAIAEALAEARIVGQIQAVGCMRIPFGGKVR